MTVGGFVVATIDGAPKIEPESPLFCKLFDIRVELGMETKGFVLDSDVLVALRNGLGIVLGMLLDDAKGLDTVADDEAIEPLSSFSEFGDPVTKLLNGFERGELFGGAKGLGLVKVLGTPKGDELGAIVSGSGYDRYCPIRNSR